MPAVMGHEITELGETAIYLTLSQLPAIALGVCGGRGGSPWIACVFFGGAKIQPFKVTCLLQSASLCHTAYLANLVAGPMFFSPSSKQRGILHFQI